MKLSKFLVLGLMALSLPVKGFEGAGSHGGNLLQSRLDYTIVALDSLTKIESGLWWAVAEARGETSSKAFVQIPDPTVRSLLKEIVALPELLPEVDTEAHQSNAPEHRSSISETQSIQIVKKFDGPCEIDKNGVPHASSLLPGRAPIRLCMSVSMLRKYTTESLVGQLVPTVFHELIHLVNLNKKLTYEKDEAQAVAVQSYVHDYMMNECRIAFYSNSDRLGRFQLEVRKPGLIEGAISGQKLGVRYETSFPKSYDLMGNDVLILHHKEEVPSFSLVTVQGVTTIRFESFNADGSVSEQELVFEGVKRVSPTFFGFSPTRIISDRITLNGKPYPVSSVEIWNSCFGQK